METLPYETRGVVENKKEIQTVEVRQTVEREKQRLARVQTQEKEKGGSYEKGGDCRMTNYKQREDLIPIEEVLEDMKLGGGIVSEAAKDYYRIHYATEEEKRLMDREDRLNTIKAMSVYAIMIVLLIIAIVGEY